MALVVKQIKPLRLKIEAVLNAIESEAMSIADDMLLDFELTTATWNHQVEFEQLVSIGANGDIEIFVGTDDEIYGYVNNGTKPHEIRPIRASVLAFPSGYNAKTQPGKMVSRSGGSYGETVFAKRVMHPGTEARNFDKTITKDWEPKTRRRFEQALKRAVRASGHAI